MRSELVFRARDRVANKYLLCRATARTTRCLHFASASTTDAITDAFVRIADESNPEIENTLSYQEGPIPVADRPVYSLPDVPLPVTRLYSPLFVHHASQVLDSLE